MDEPAPLSQSRVWELQRAFYEDNASEAFAEIPHQIVDNPFVAAAYARVVVGYLRDCARGGLDLDEPLYVVELGAGPGRFAHGFRRELDAFVQALPFALPPIVYVMTDLGESTIQQWAANPALDDERFDFARFDVGGDGVLNLRRRGIALDRLANPLVVIANYVFDSIPADAFAISDGGVQECLVSVEGADVASMQLAFSRGPVRSYGDPDLDALLEHYRDHAGRHRGHAPARRHQVRAAAARAGRRPAPAARRGQDPQHRGVPHAALRTRAQPSTAAASR